jgi:hypothetical protein
MIDITGDMTFLYFGGSLFMVMIYCYPAVDGEKTFHNIIWKIEHE